MSFVTKSKDPLFPSPMFQNAARHITQGFQSDCINSTSDILKPIEGLYGGVLGAEQQCRHEDVSHYYTTRSSTPDLLTVHKKKDLAFDRS